MIKYYPYPAYDGKHKYYILTESDKKVYFGAAGYSDFTKHKSMKERKNRYMNSGTRIMVKIGLNQV
jgi:hypothetical protein